MKLTDWLKDNKVTQTDFAERIGVTPGFISQICSGTSRPGLDRIGAIHRETLGQVTAADWIDLPEQAA